MSLSTNLSHCQSQLSQGEFKSLLTTLANKPKKATITDAGRSVELIGVIGRLWQTIKGWIGFTNQSDLVKVNFKLMRLFCEGERQPYFQNTEIKDLIKRAQEQLSGPTGDKRYADFAAAIKETLSSPGSKLVDRVFSYKRDHSNELGERGWQKLIHRFAPTPANFASLNFEQGQTALKEGRYPDAIKCFESAVKIDPTHIDIVEILLALSEAYYLRSQQLVKKDPVLEVAEVVEIQSLLKSSIEVAARTEDALVDTNLAAKRRSLTVNAVKKLIDMHLLLATSTLPKSESAAREILANASAAIHQYRQVLDDPKDLASIWNRISGLYQECNDTIKALESAEKAVKLHETQEYSEAAVKLFERLVSVDSVDAYQELIKQRPSDWRIYFYLGVFQFKQNDMVGSVHSFNAAVSLNPARPEPFLFLGRVHLLLQEQEKALQFYERVIAVHRTPEQAKFAENEILVIYKGMASQVVEGKDYDAALEAYQLAIKRLPAAVDSLIGDVITFAERINRINPIMALKAYKLALPHLTDENIRIDQLTQVYLALGREAIAQNQLQVAKGVLGRVAQMNSGNLSVLRQLGVLYIKANELQSAEYIFREMIGTGQGTACDHRILKTLTSRGEMGQDELRSLIVKYSSNPY